MPIYDIGHDYINIKSSSTAVGATDTLLLKGNQIIMSGDISVDKNMYLNGNVYLSGPLINNGSVVDLYQLSKISTDFNILQKKMVNDLNENTSNILTIVNDEFKSELLKLELQLDSAKQKSDDILATILSDLQNEQQIRSINIDNDLNNLEQRITDNLKDQDSTIFKFIKEYISEIRDTIITKFEKSDKLLLDNITNYVNDTKSLLINEYVLCNTQTQQIIKDYITTREIELKRIYDLNLDKVKKYTDDEIMKNKLENRQLELLSISSSKNYINLREIYITNSYMEQYNALKSTMLTKDSPQTIKNKIINDPSNEISANKILNVIIKSNPLKSKQVLTSTSLASAEWETVEPHVVINNSQLILPADMDIGGFLGDPNSKYLEINIGGIVYKLPLFL